jgi:hypothetical protein
MAMLLQITNTSRQGGLDIKFKILAYKDI